MRFSPYPYFQFSLSPDYFLEERKIDNGIDLIEKGNKPIDLVRVGSPDEENSLPLLLCHAIIANTVLYSFKI